MYDRDEMARRGRIGAKVTHAKHDPRELTRAAREALAEKRRREAARDLCRELQEGPR